MKKIIILIFISTLIVACSKDADDTGSELQDFTVIINVDPNHYIGEFHISTYAFLSDESGTILDSGEIRLGETTTLSFSGEPSMKYDLSYMRFNDISIIDQKTFDLLTLTDIEQGTYNIGADPSTESTFDEIYLNLSNTGYPCEHTSSTPGTGTFGPENGGYYNYRGNLEGSPASDFYISFKSPNDQFDRYFFGENITEGAVFDLDYTTLLEIQNSVDVQIPSSTIYNFGLEGLINGDANNIHHGIREGNYPSGNTSLSIPVPINIFDNYLLRLSFGDNDFQYFKSLHTEIIPNIVDPPELSFTVNNPSPENFNFSTTGNAIVYDVIFRGGNSNETVFVSHGIFGEAAPEVSFSKEVLRKNIQQNYPDITGFETLPLGSVSLTHYSAINTYNEILKNRIEGKNYEVPIGEFYEGVSKLFD